MGAALSLVALSAASVGMSAVAVGAPSAHSVASMRSASKAPASVHVLKTQVGKILVTASGRTMYLFAKDSKNVSRCSGTCLTYWPAVPAKQAPKRRPAGVTAKFGSIKRANGFRQLTINGWPAYTFVGDTKAGAVTGQGVLASGAKWWVFTAAGTPNKTMPKPTPTPSPSGSPSSGPTPTYSPSPRPSYTIPA